ncbi:MAG: sulfur oxidation c-type cytochrome SoxX [Alphaproteobacteria bacterium]
MMREPPFLAMLLVLASFAVLTGASAGPAPAWRVDNGGIPTALTAVPGDPVNGRKVVIAPKLGNCLACHAMPIPEEPDHGQVASSLSGIGSRLDAAKLRLRIVDPKRVTPDTMMPSFFRTEGFHRVLKDFEGRTILTAQEVEDVVAYLLTLK